MLSQTSVAAAPQPPKPMKADIASDFALDPAIDFLNHGSFGARPRKVMDAQSKRRAEFEARPIEWLDRRRHEMILRAKNAIAPFLGFAPANLGFVTNATGGVNAVLHSLKFQAGDELLTTNHVYNAVRQSMKYFAARAGAIYVEANVPLPLKADDEVVNAIDAAITERTRLLIIDHITSPTAVVFPVRKIIDLCNERGVDVLVDGAHAPGMVQLNIESLGCAYYAGNLHKWMCAPVGAGFIWVRPDKQSHVHPPIISHFLNESFIAEFNWQGTRDITPWLCVEDAFEYLNELGWDRVMMHNHQLALWLQNMLCKRWNVPPSTPVDGSMIGSMITVLLPGQEKLRERFADFTAVRAALYDRFRIEVPVVEWGEPPGQWWVRPCCQVYNAPEQYVRLADAIEKLLA